MRKLLFAFGLIFSTGSAIAADNYLATQGSGTTFAAKDGGAGLLFPRVIGCDNTTTTQCWTIDSSGRLSALTNPATPASWGIGTSTQNSATIANGILQLGQFNTTPTTITTGNMSPIQLDSAGNLLVNVKAGGAGGGAVTAASGAYASGSIASGAMVDLGAQADAAWVSGSGTLIAIAKNIANGIAAPATMQAATTGGASPTGNIAANNTTAVVVKASAGTLYGVQVYGIGSAPAYLKIYNATSATCGSGTPVKRLMIPAASTAANGAGSNILFAGDVGVAFGTGITYCVTTGITDADTTAPAASTYLVNLDWK